MLNYKRPGFWVVILSVLILLSTAFILLSNPQPRYSNLTAEKIESMTLISGLDDTKHTVIIDSEEWADIIDLINTAERSKIAEEYRPTYGGIVNMGVKNADGSVCYIVGLRKDIRAKIGKQAGNAVK